MTKILFLIAGLLVLSGTAHAQQIFRFGYPGCDLMVQSEYFTLQAGDSFSVSVDKSQCLERDIGRIGFWGKVVKGWRARDIEPKDGLELTVAGPVGAIASEKAVLDEPGPAVWGYVIRNTNNGKPVTLRVNVQSGQ